MKISDKERVVRVKAAPRALFKVLPSLLNGSTEAVVIKGYDKATGPVTADYHQALTRYVLARSGYNLADLDYFVRRGYNIDPSVPKKTAPNNTDLTVQAYTMAADTPTLEHSRTELYVPGPFTASDTVLVVSNELPGDDNEVIRHGSGLYVINEIGLVGHPVGNLRLVA